MNELVQHSDGFDVAEGGGILIAGKLILFREGKYYTNKVDLWEQDTRLIVIRTVTVWIKWENERPAEQRVTRSGMLHPEREYLPDLEQALWAIGRDGKPSDPWADIRYLIMVHPLTAQEYTFSTHSYGGRRAVGDLKSQIRNVRYQPGAIPEILLASEMMKTNYGPKPKPLFVVQRWRNVGGTEQPQQQIEAAPATVTLDLDDTIPF